LSDQTQQSTSEFKTQNDDDRNTMSYQNLAAKSISKPTIASALSNVFTIASDLYLELLAVGEK
jgi:hypothetical protein